MINLRQNKGFALTFSLIFLFLIVSFIAVYFLAIANGISEANRLTNKKTAYYIADAGLADAYERITQSGGNIVTSNSSYIPSSNTDNGSYSVGSTSGNYTVSVAYSGSPRANYTIISTGTYNNVSETLQLKIITAAISRWAYWSQTEINPQYGQLWWVGTPSIPYVTTGPVQTNGTLNIFGDPIFNGVVTQTNGDGGSSPNYYYGTTTIPNDFQSNFDPSDPTEVFPDGITDNAPKLNLPSQQTLSSLEGIASNGSGLVLTGNSTVIFNPTGTISVTGTVVNSGCKTTATYTNTTMNPPANGVIYVQSTATIPACNSTAQDGNVTVQGTVSGQLTVAADRNIYISGDVAYNNDPRTDPNSTDMVGLVANQNITVIEADVPTYLELSAVMVALQGSFQVDQWWVYRGNGTQAVLDQFGSLINYVCGVTGEMDLSGDLLGGWNQLQSYDTRLQYIAPPGFPAFVNNSGTGVYAKESIMECNSGICG